MIHVAKANRNALVDSVATVQYSTVKCSMVQHSTVQYSTEQ